MNARELDTLMTYQTRNVNFKGKMTDFIFCSEKMLIYRKQMHAIASSIVRVGLDGCEEIYGADSCLSFTTPGCISPSNLGDFFPV